MISNIDYKHTILIEVIKVLKGQIFFKQENKVITIKMIVANKYYVGIDNNNPMKNE